MYVGVFFALGDTRCVQVGCILWITLFFWGNCKVLIQI